MRDSRTVQLSIFDFYEKHEFGNFLAELSCMLDDKPELVILLESDLIRDGVLPTGRKGLSVESVLHCLLLKQITNVSYDKLAFHLPDSQSYRAFARQERDCYPGKSALCTNIRRVQPETLQKVFDQLAINNFSDGMIDSKTIRQDSTVVKSNIAGPSDSRLLDDGVRVLSRLFEPHMGIIVKAKHGIEYGHKINLSTDKHGYITTRLIEDGNPRDSDRFIPIPEEHHRLYGGVPTTTIADGCYASCKNDDNAKKELGVKRVAFHRKNGITLSFLAGSLEPTGLDNPDCRPSVAGSFVSSRFRSKGNAFRNQSF